MILVYDGPNGCGKTAVAKRMTAALGECGRKVVTFREPGGTEIGEKVRILLKDPSHKIESPWAQVFLFGACRFELAKQIKQYDARGFDVVLDRWWFSTYAYQGALGCDRELIADIHTRVLESIGLVINPHLCFWVECEPEIAWRRSNAAKTDISNDRWEREGIEFADKLYDGYAQLWNKGLLTRIIPDPKGTEKDAFHTAWKELCHKIETAVGAYTECPTCRGSGRSEMDGVCGLCEGKSEITWDSYWNYKAHLAVPGAVFCPACFGTGRIIGRRNPPTVFECALCDGSGRALPKAVADWRREASNGGS